ncbi:tyrosine-type recombinase/integrase [Catenovulum agarivorans]|uniref:tyrosine-type recombinase/integrase n=1 Tax=Catenovulum agarivorans TaxID=1172192 RepID=UPI0003022B46|nr:integrase arm-type DNA-binding domain-containing protein [Catenovulum agarivorans]
MKRNLTDSTIKKLEAQEKGYKTTDGGGLYIYTTTAGNKSWRYDFKLNGKYQTVVLGTYPELSLLAARKMHDEYRDSVKQGIHPKLKAKRDEQLSRPFSYYALEMLKTQELRQATEIKKRKTMERHLFPVLDKMDVTQITANDLLDLIKPIAKQGKRETAQILATYCRQTFDILLSRQMISINPAESISRLIPKPKPPTNFAHITDEKEFAKILIGIENYEGDFVVKQALKLMVLIFLRPYNMRFLKWEYIDFNEKLITIPADEMKMNRSHKVPLATQAIEILKAVQPLTIEDKFVFASERSRKSKVMSENTLNQALMRVIHPETGKPLGRGVITSHGIRHTVSTMLNELKYDSDAIELSLAHMDKDRIRSTYNKAELLPERTIMMQEWADYVDNLKN